MIPITLDKVRHLKFSPNAIADAEELLRKNLPAIIEDGGVSAVRALLWAGLRWEDRALTVEQAGSLIDVWMTTQPYDQLELKIVEALKTDGWFREMARQEEPGE